MASRAAVAAALARMDTRRRGFEPISWRTSERSRRCSWCGAKRGLLVYVVKPYRQPARTFGNGPDAMRRPALRWSTMYARCFDEEACKARSGKAYRQRQGRSGNLRWAQSRFESPNIDLPKGSCRWCGEPIEFTPDADYRTKQRQRHRGDDAEVGDRNCRREHDRTFAANPRLLVQHRGDPCCVDCGAAEEWTDPAYGEGEGWWKEVPWEADHVIPVEDGGPHTPVNIARRCVECHRRKTNAENAARRAKRAASRSPGRSVSSTSA